MSASGPSFQDATVLTTSKISIPQNEMAFHQGVENAIRLPYGISVLRVILYSLRIKYCQIRSHALLYPSPVF